MLAEIYLYLILHDDDSRGERFRNRMPDLQTCLKVVENAKMPTPSDPGGDYEVMGVMWCGTGEFEKYRDNYKVWYKTPLEE